MNVFLCVFFFFFFSSRADDQFIAFRIGIEGLKSQSEQFVFVFNILLFSRPIKCCKLGKNRNALSRLRRFFTLPRR